MKNQVSIDIGSKNIHVAEGRYEKGQLYVNKTESYPVPEGSILKEIVENQEELSDAILYAVKLVNYFGKNASVTVNAAGHTIVKELEFPPAKARDLDSMIRNEMVQVHNILPTDVIQYKEIEKNINENKMNRYRISSVSRDLVDGYHKTLKNANLRSSTMDINSNAIDKLFHWATAFNEKNIQEDEAILLIDFGNSTTSVYIAFKGQAIFYRHINMGAGEIDRILANELYKSPEEIENIKNHENIFEASLLNSEKDPYDALRYYFNNLNDEIRKVLTFFRGRFRNTQVSRGYIFGAGSKLKGYSEFWDFNLNLPIDSLKSIQGSNAAKIDVNPEHINAIAALIRN